MAHSSKLRIAYHGSHEQFKPSELLGWASEAEKQGFDALFSSDHFHPWSDKQGQAGFSWCWMGAALASTTLPGGLVCCPAYRYHPAVVAQGAATLAEMFPGRFWLAVGSGQALNERITGEPWPTKDTRNAKLVESVQVIRALWAGETVTHRGLVTCEEAKLYTRPATAPPLFGAAVTEATAKWVGGWADGLITTSRPPADLKRMVAAFREGGGEGKPMALKVGLSYARDEAAAKHNAFTQWRTACFPNEVLTELRNPLLFEAAAQHVRPEDVGASLRISSELQQHQEWLAADVALGFCELERRHQPERVYRGLRGKGSAGTSLRLRGHVITSTSRRTIRMLCCLNRASRSRLNSRMSKRQDPSSRTRMMVISSRKVTPPMLHAPSLR